MGDRRKRRTGEEQPSSDSNDQNFRPKRITAVPPFDAKRAESSRQHVRALNSQFARWVQNQLRDHPDELWQDGVQDYIKHASEILVQFSDVVEWLKANANLSQQNVPVSLSNGVSPSVEKKVVKEDSKSELPVQVEESKKPGIGLPSGSWSFGLTPNNQSSSTAGPWSFGLASANQSSPVTGNLFRPPVPASEAGGASNSQEEDGDDVERPPSPSVKRAEEPGTAVVHEVKCKLYAKPESGAEKGWKDMGMGQLYIKCKEDATIGTKEAKATIVIRNDVGKVVLNALLYPNIKLNVQKNTITTILYTADGDLKNDEAGREKKEVGKARLYLLKLKSEDEAKKLEEAIIKNAPAAE
ncbi:hypothetical protein SUGI_0590410 [Cryptomeria japonica]|nr:hypothetical protein SUGI_0590410 [Cryptomeria japonica]